MVGKKSLFLPYDRNPEGNHDFHNEIGQVALCPTLESNVLTIRRQKSI